jgi:hypothetical protein
MTGRSHPVVSYLTLYKRYTWLSVVKQRHNEGKERVVNSPTSYTRGPGFDRIPWQTIFSELIQPVTVAARSKARTAFTCSNTGVVNSNPTQSMSVCAFILCVGSGLGTGWSPVQGVLLTVWKKYETEEEARAQQRAVEPRIDRAKSWNITLKRTRPLPSTYTYIIADTYIILLRMPYSKRRYLWIRESINQKKIYFEAFYPSVWISKVFNIWTKTYRVLLLLWIFVTIFCSHFVSGSVTLQWENKDIGDARQEARRRIVIHVTGTLQESYAKQTELLFHIEYRKLCVIDWYILYEVKVLQTVIVKSWDTYDWWIML